MLVRVDTACPARCGARVEGEVDTTSREFVHRFRVPEGSAPASQRTEVTGRHLATFAPDSKDWFVPCPVCAARIPIDTPGMEGGAGA